MKDIIQSYFSGEAVRQLGQAASLDATVTQRALSLGLPLQLDALAAHAAQPEGRTQLGEAISNLPRFGSVAEALASPNGAANLRQAGELLAPTLLGGQAEQIVQEVTRRVGGGAGGVQQVLQMSLPLLLSLLGRQGLNAVNADSMLGRLRGTLQDLNLAGLSAGAATATGTTTVIGAAPAAGEPPVSGAALPAADLTTPGGLLAALRAPFEGQAAEQVGRAAGLSGGNAGRMVLGALPLVLSALVNKGRTEAGAAEVLKMSQPFDRLVGTDGRLDPALLGDSAEMARVEGQGRGLLGGLFSNVDALTGRLGTALGGSGAGAGRLLAVLTPLVLGVLGQRARSAGTGPQALSGLLGGMAELLPGLIPSGMGGLAGLLGAGTMTAAPPASSPATTTTVTPSIPEPVVTQGAPVTSAPAAPAPVTPAPRAVPPPPPPPVTTSAVTTTERRRGFPWWLGLIPLLLIGGCLWNQNRTQTTTTATTTTTTDAGGIIVSNPESGSNLPPEAFTMSGTAAPNMNLVIQDEGQEVAQATADASGNWTAEIPAPTPGEHTYSIIGGENARSEFKVNITDAAGTTDTDAAGATTDPATGTDGAATDSTDTGTTTEPATGSTDAAGTFAVNEPASGAEVPGTGFNLTGTGEAGQTYELLEDGTSVGTFTVAEDGTWSADVAAPSEGDKTYTIRSEDGTEVASLPVTVAAATGDVASCTQDLSVSVQDGETVTAPFRFGGVGSGEGYRVTVIRGGRTVGTRNIPLTAGCAWSYNSNPGGRAGQVNDVTYEVRPIGTDLSEPATTTLNLQVRQP